MKFKIFLILAILLLCSCLTVNAENNISNEEKNVTVGNIDVPALNIDIVWGSMEFTLNEEINYTWKDNTKTYELESVKYSWIASNNNINISNYSYRDINVNLIYNSLYDSIEGNFDKENETITRNSNMSFELNLSGQIINNENKVIKVGTIDLLIS